MYSALQGLSMTLGTSSMRCLPFMILLIKLLQVLEVIIFRLRRFPSTRQSFHLHWLFLVCFHLARQITLFRGGRRWRRGELQDVAFGVVGFGLRDFVCAELFEVQFLNMVGWREGKVSEVKIADGGGR